jgi:hypothetical protein
MPTLVIPRAPEQYGRDEEQVFRDITRRGIENALGRNELPQYSGVPIVFANGTATGFSATNGATPITAPFNTVVDNTSLHTMASNAITVTMGGTYQLITSLFHLGAGATKTVNVSICIFKAAVEIWRETTQRDPSLSWDASCAWVGVLAKSDVISVRVLHSDTVPILFDMTKSKLMLTQLTPNPTYLDRTRV